jgi:hypothetical protein
MSDTDQTSGDFYDQYIDPSTGHRINNPLQWLINFVWDIDKKVTKILNRPTQGIIKLQEKEGSEMAASKKTVAPPTFTMAELSSKGGTLQLYDEGDNPTPFPTTPLTTTWTSSDPTVLTVTPDATNPQKAAVKSTGKIGNVKLDCIVHATDTPPSFGDLDCFCNVTVPAGAPSQGTIQLA